MSSSSSHKIVVVAGVMALKIVTTSYVALMMPLKEHLYSCFINCCLQKNWDIDFIKIH
jgi:hypothetical protein